MKNLHHRWRSQFNLFEKRLCFDEVLKNGENEVNIAESYADKDGTQQKMDEIMDNAAAKIDKIPEADADAKLIIKGKMKAMEESTQNQLNALESSPEIKDKAAERSKILKNFGQRLKEYKSQVIAKGSPANDLLPSDARGPVQSLQATVKEKNDDTAGATLQDYIKLLQGPNIKWDSNEDHDRALKAVLSLGDDMVLGYLNYKGAEGDGYFYGPLTRWTMEQGNKDTTKKEDVDALAKIITEGRKKVEAETESFRQETSEYKKNFLSARSALELGDSPTLDGVFMKPDYSITLGDKKGFEPLVKAKTAELRQAFQIQIDANNLLITSLKGMLSPKDGLPAEKAEEGKKFLDQLQRCEDRLAGILLPPNADVVFLGTYAIPFRKIVHELVTLNGQVNNLVSPNPSANESGNGAPAGDSAAGGVGVDAKPDQGATKPASVKTPEGKPEAAPASIATKYFKITERPNGYKKKALSPPEVVRTVPAWVKNQAEKVLQEARSTQGVDKRGYYYFSPSSDKNTDPLIMVRILRPEGKKEFELRYYSKEEAASLTQTV